MGLFLKQSTGVTLKIGPFLDKTDGDTEETGALLAADVFISKNGGAFANKNEATAPAHDANGMYACLLDATDTNTLGRLQLYVHKSGTALYVYHEFMVVTANFYDSICSTDVLQADLTQMGGVAQSATDLKDFADTGYDPATHKVQGLVLCDTTTTNTDMVDVSDLATILADTNELQTDWHNGGRLDLLIDAIKAITDTLVLADIADAVLDEVVDTNNPANANSLREVVNVMSAALAGKSSGGGTANIKFRDLGDTKDRISATVDADGNRTAITDDGT
jgi:hypothetical protein